MTPEYGAQTQLEKIGMLEVADFVVLNKYEKPRSEDALRDIRKQYRRNHMSFLRAIRRSPADGDLPVYGTMASKFNDVGVNALFYDIVGWIRFRHRRSGIPCRGRRAPSSEGADHTRGALPVFEGHRFGLQGVQQERWRRRPARWGSGKHCGKLRHSFCLKTLNWRSAGMSAEQSLAPGTLEELDGFERVIEEYRTGRYSYRVRGQGDKGGHPL